MDSPLSRADTSSSIQGRTSASDAATPGRQTSSAARMWCRRELTALSAGPGLLVTGSGAPTAGMVYKLVEVDGITVQKRSAHKASAGGTKEALRVAKPSGTIVEEIVHPAGHPPPTEPGFVSRPLSIELVRGGHPVHEPDLEQARARAAAGLGSLPWDGLKLSKGEPAIPTRVVAPDKPPS